jgi:hypothetical protein
VESEEGNEGWVETHHFDSALSPLSEKISEISLEVCKTNSLLKLVDGHLEIFLKHIILMNFLTCELPTIAMLVTRTVIINKIIFSYIIFILLLILCNNLLIFIT